MIEMLLVLVISFFTTYLLAPKFIKYLRKIGVVTADVHKKGMPLVPHSAGIPVVAGILLGLLFYTFMQTFVFNNSSNVLEVFVVATTVLIAMLGGFIDDLIVKQIKVKGYNEGKTGLRALYKPLLTIPAVLPLVVIKAGYSTMSIPFFGTINFGILYPLLIVPVGVFGSTNMINMLGGFNGMEMGMGFIYMSSLGLFALLDGINLAAMIFLTTAAALLAMLKYNFYPAKILSGDSIQYAMGSIVACGIIIGNMEKIGLITMIPFLVQGALKFYAKIRLGFFPSNLGILQKDGTLKSKYGKNIYSWTHLIMNLGNFTEKQITLIMMAIQLVFSIIPFLKII
jgi:UDP-N-acetylglucosamine--dolichyl-phosphate N-acetylglucosaminephosphotransferase